jgi:hypothetical protein
MCTRQLLTLGVAVVFPIAAGRSPASAAGSNGTVALPGAAEKAAAELDRQDFARSTCNVHPE